MKILKIVVDVFTSLFSPLESGEIIQRNIQRKKIYKRRLKKINDRLDSDVFDLVNQGPKWNFNYVLELSYLMSDLSKQTIGILALQKGEPKDGSASHIKSSKVFVTKATMDKLGEHSQKIDKRKNLVNARDTMSDIIKIFGDNFQIIDQEEIMEMQGGTLGPQSDVKKGTVTLAHDLLNEDPHNYVQVLTLDSSITYEIETFHASKNDRISSVKDIRDEMLKVWEYYKETLKDKKDCESKLASIA